MRWSGASQDSKIKKVSAVSGVSQDGTITKENAQEQRLRKRNNTNNQNVIASRAEVKQSP